MAAERNATPYGRPTRAPRANAAPSGSHSPESHDVITSRDNRWIKAFRAALQGTGPDAGEPIGVEGPKLIEEAFRARCEAEALLLSASGEHALERILRAAQTTEAGIARSRILRTTDRLFEAVAGTEAPQGVAALFKQPDWQFDDILRGTPSPEGALTGDSPLVIIAAGVQDPGNLGTIMRSAEAFGATGAVATRGTADPWSPKALRASAGSALRLPLLRGIAAPVLMAQLRVAGLKIYAATAHTAPGAGRSDADPTSQATMPDLREPCAIFIGGEGAGLAPEIERAADARISIPIRDSVESLNAGVAASLVLYEAARQRKQS
jgi:TrmH family RNA methyltransferase